MMIQKTLMTASLCGLFSIAVPAVLLGHAGRAGQQAQSGQQTQQKATKSISGKVTEIGEQGHSFSVETDDGASKQTMKFVVDRNTQVQGQVKVGTLVAVDYQPTEDGQLVCVRVAPQNG